MTLSPAEQLTAIVYGDTFALYDDAELAATLGELAGTIRSTA